MNWLNSRITITSRTLSSTRALLKWDRPSAKTPPMPHSRDPPPSMVLLGLYMVTNKVHLKRRAGGLFRCSLSILRKVVTRNKLHFYLDSHNPIGSSKITNDSGLTRKPTTASALSIRLIHPTICLRPTSISRVTVYSIFTWVMWTPNTTSKRTPMNWIPNLIPFREFSLWWTPIIFIWRMMWLCFNITPHLSLFRLKTNSRRKTWTVL